MFVVCELGEILIAVSRLAARHSGQATAAGEFRRGSRWEFAAGSTESSGDEYCPRALAFCFPLRIFVVFQFADSRARIAHLECEVGLAIRLELGKVAWSLN